MNLLLMSSKELGGSSFPQDRAQATPQLWNPNPEGGQTFHVKGQEGSMAFQAI